MNNPKSNKNTVMSTYRYLTDNREDNYKNDFYGKPGK